MPVTALPVAARNMTKVSNPAHLELPAVERWNWKPRVKDQKRLKDSLVASTTFTSQQTFTNQVDHGEYY